MTSPTYPVQLSVDYPDRPLNRVTTLLRVFVAIPILVVLGRVIAYALVLVTDQYPPFRLAA